MHMIRFSLALYKITNQTMLIGLEEIKTKLNHLIIETKSDRTVKFGTVHGLLFIF